MSAFILLAMAGFLLIALASVVAGKPFNNVRTEDAERAKAADAVTIPNHQGD